MTPEEAKRFGEKHVTVWNKHKLDDIMDLYTEDVELRSPLAMKVVDSGVVKERAAVRKYFEATLVKYPDL